MYNYVDLSDVKSIGNLHDLKTVKIYGIYNRPNSVFYLQKETGGTACTAAACTCKVRR